MTEFLLFRLYGPLASWGDIAVGERRGSWSRPSKSAVLGLVAAALGIERHEQDRQRALAEGLGFAVRVDAPGVAMRDYHTTQTAREANLKPVRKAKGRALTRRDVLSVEAPETILSQRDYYADALYTIALWARAGVPYAAGDLAVALRHPRFTLYLGRKSCPPTLPLCPEVIVKDHLAAALDAYSPPEPPGLRQPLAALLNRRRAPALLAWENDVMPADVVRRLHRERRRDAPLDRGRWHFVERDEHVAVLP